MIVRKDTQVLIIVEMTEEQSTNLQTALKKANEVVTTSSSGETFSREEAEVMTDLRQSLLNL